MVQTEVERFDFDEPRLDAQGFVIDYFEWRIAEDHHVWHESPGLPDGKQPEHKAMRKLAAIFERRHREELETFAQQILNDEDLVFPRYCDVLEEFGRVENDNGQCMSYGRLVGVMAFGGRVAAKMISVGQRRQVQQVALYTSRFIDSRIKLSWAREQLSWDKFLCFAKDIIRRDERKQAEEAAARRRQSRRWSLGVFAVGTAAVVLAGGVIGARSMLSK